jgi:hypothetical protein
MHPFDRAAWLTRFAGHNFAFNLGFFPPERLAWKPAPTANSPFEIAQHVAMACLSALPTLSGGAYQAVSPPVPTDLAEAQALVRDATARYADALLAVDPARLEETVRVPFGEFPFAQFATFPTFDVMHHHGQITYLQTMLGDTESHFDLQPEA